MVQPVVLLLTLVEVEQYNELLDVRERKIAVEKEVAILKEEKEDALQNQYAELQKLVQRVHEQEYRIFHDVIVAGNKTEF